MIQKRPDNTLLLLALLGIGGYVLLTTSSTAKAAAPAPTDAAGASLPRTVVMPSQDPNAVRINPDGTPYNWTRPVQTIKPDPYQSPPVVERVSNLLSVLAIGGGGRGRASPFSVHVRK